MKSYEYGNILSDYASAYFNMGIDQYMGEKPKDVSNAYKKALEVRPGSPDVLNNISLSYADMGINLIEAEAMAKSAIDGYTAEEKKINDADTLGWIYYRMGRYRDAFATLDMCSDVLSEETSYQYHLGMTLFALNKLSEDEHLLSMAIPMLGAKAREDALLTVGPIRKTFAKGSRSPY